ncbi:radical sam domain-containing protein, partial [Cystoisospora suis]
MHAIAEDFSLIKVNVVLLRGFNDNEIEDFVQLTESLPIHVRFIEFMPFHQNGWSYELFVSKKEILSRIQRAFPSLRSLSEDQETHEEKERGEEEEENKKKQLKEKKIKPRPGESACVYYVPGFEGCVGVISSLSDHFCSSCNRL